MILSLGQSVRNFSKLFFAAILASLIASPGCGGKIPPTNYYVLELPPAPRASADPLPAVAAVMPFRASRMLTQDRIVYRPSEGQVGFYEYHRWAEDPREALTSTFIEDLRAHNTFETVIPFDGRTDADYVIQGHIERLEEVDFGGGVSVVVELSAEMLSIEERKLVWQGSSEERGQVTVGEVSAVVSEMSRAARASLSELIGSLDNHVRSNVTPPSREEAESR